MKSPTLAFVEDTEFQRVWCDACEAPKEDEFGYFHCPCEYEIGSPSCERRKEYDALIEALDGVCEEFIGGDCE